MRVNVLFTSVGRRVELVQAFRGAYDELALTGKIIGLDISPLAPALRVVDEPYIVPRNTADDFIETLSDIGRKEQVNLIFPLIDPDISILSQARATLETTGAKVVTVPLQSAEIAGDKWLTYQFLKSLNIQTPSTWLPTDVPPDIHFPLFIKPRFGSASENVFRVEDDRELKFFSDYIQQPVVQELLPGSEITNDVLCDLEGNVLSIVSRKRLEVRGGEVVKGVTISDSKIHQTCEVIASELSSIGPITVQCIMKDAEPYFTEINARFGGGLPLGIAAGIHSPKILLARYAGVDLDVPPIGEYKVGLHISRFDDSFFLNEAQLDEMASNRL